MPVQNTPFSSNYNTNRGDISEHGSTASFGSFQGVSYQQLYQRTEQNLDSANKMVAKLVDENSALLRENFSLRQENAMLKQEHDRQPTM